MYAIVEIAGQQFRVSAGQEIFVHHLSTAKQGDSLTFDRVLLTDDGNNITVGAPVLTDVAISATVLETLVKGDKVIVFKKKRRKGYRKKNGHRQQFTKLFIDAVGDEQDERQQRRSEVAVITNDETI